VARRRAGKRGALYFAQGSECFAPSDDMTNERSSRCFQADEPPDAQLESTDQRRC
jgi:hypothetical protein